MKIIGLTGFAKSGKSTAAEVLKEMGGQELAFAKHLKDVCSLVFDVQRTHFDDQNFKEVEFYMPTLLTSAHVGTILDYFEVPMRQRPNAILKHSGRYLLSPRHIAQYVGTELLRSVSTDIHVDMAFKLNEGTTAPFLICSDVRFENELVAVQRAGGVVVGIKRSAATPQGDKVHGSEAEIPELLSRSTYVVHNEYEIDYLKEFVSSAAKLYLAKK